MQICQSFLLRTFTFRLSASTQFLLFQSCFSFDLVADFHTLTETRVIFFSTSSSSLSLSQHPQGLLFRRRLLRAQAANNGDPPRGTERLNFPERGNARQKAVWRMKGEGKDERARPAAAKVEREGGRKGKRTIKTTNDETMEQITIADCFCEWEPNLAWQNVRAAENNATCSNRESNNAASYRQNAHFQEEKKSPPSFCATANSWLMLLWSLFLPLPSIVPKERVPGTAAVPGTICMQYY